MGILAMPKPSFKLLIIIAIIAALTIKYAVVL